MKKQVKDLRQKLNIDSDDDSENDDEELEDNDDWENDDDGDEEDNVENEGNVEKTNNDIRIELNKRILSDAKGLQNTLFSEQLPSSLLGMVELKDDVIDQFINEGNLATLPGTNEVEIHTENIKQTYLSIMEQSALKRTAVITDKADPLTTLRRGSKLTENTTINGSEQDDKGTYTYTYTWHAQEHTMHCSFVALSSHHFPIISPLLPVAKQHAKSSCCSRVCRKPNNQIHATAGTAGMPNNSSSISKMTSLVHLKFEEQKAKCTLTYLVGTVDHQPSPFLIPSLLISEATATTNSLHDFIKSKNTFEKDEWDKWSTYGRTTIARFNSICELFCKSLLLLVLMLVSCCFCLFIFCFLRFLRFLFTITIATQQTVNGQKKTNEEKSAFWNRPNFWRNWAFKSLLNWNNASPVVVSKQDQKSERKDE